MIERRSAPLLHALRGLPGWVPFLVLLALVLGGLFAPAPLGAALLAILALVIGWLIYLAWPALAPAGRLVRLAVLALVLVAAVRRALEG
jgi:hypothetical protein